MAPSAPNEQPVTIVHSASIVAPRPPPASATSPTRDITSPSVQGSAAPASWVPARGMASARSALSSPV